MKKIMVSILVIGLLLTTSIASMNAKTCRPYIYVNDDNVSGPWDGTQEHPYQTIADGINAASDDDVIYVLSGTYDEAVNVDKSIYLFGENRDTTTIEKGVTIDNSDISHATVSGFTILKWVRLKDVSNITFKGNIIRDISSSEKWTKVMCIYGDYNTIENNIIRDISSSGSWTYAITHEGDYNTIENNIIRDISSSGSYIFGIKCNGDYNTITGNTILNLIAASFTNAIVTRGESSVITENTISNLNGRSVTGISFKTSPNITISRNSITNINSDSYANGISSLGLSSNHKITENAITNINSGYFATGIGIMAAFDSPNSNSTIMGNAITNINSMTGSALGIYLSQSHNITIEGNTIDTCNTGVHLWLCSYIYISENNISNCLKGNYKDEHGGILLIDSTYNLITHNNFNGNTRDATFVFYHFLGPDEEIPWFQIPDSFDKTKINSTIWYQNYWNRPMVIPKKITGKLDVSKDTPGGSIHLYDVTLYNYDPDPLWKQYGSAQSTPQSNPSPSSQPSQQTSPSSETQEQSSPSSSPTNT